ncbi:STAS domain-containing protein [Kribbella qitaiheensis]|uniref:Anti-sigma factor antagonist n=1 Tax=Kribbella qitaiheensis TaxID=1544730 RepID=A0A7G6WS87_9ACTN|nr:STAS domain-containing protein [Kribbella qitaiheensis]QNE16852.1 STAS domain-containing protein [Kribbella qitaiheensis]
MSEEMLSVEVLDRGPDVVIGVHGELDFGTISDLMAVVQPAAEAGRSVILDLAELAFCDSSGLGAFVRLHQLAADAGGSLCLARLRPALESTIKLTMLHRLLVIRADLPAVDAAADPA